MGSLNSMSERLLARAPTAADLTAYEEHFLDPRIGRWLRPSPLPPFDEPQVLELLDRDRCHWDDHGFGPWLLEDAASGEFVGRGGLAWTEVDGRLALELPWSIQPARHNQGLATEAAARALDQAGELGFEETLALILPYNAASRRVAEKIGMAADGEVLHAGLPHLLYRARIG